jgi:hypothetical protein
MREDEGEMWRVWRTHEDCENERQHGALKMEGKII